MTDQELQEAIDKARAFISPQLDYKNTPSQELKDFTIRHIKELQAIQVMRAGMATQPTLRIKDEA